jgi:dTDP-4-dehydrorhamnose reductase
MSKKIVCLGSNGFLGIPLVRFLKKNGFTIIEMSKNSKKNSINAANSYELNLFLEKIKPDIILNLIALTNVDLCFKNPHLAYQTNVITVKNISDYLKNNKNVRLVHISTDNIYDGPGYKKEEEINIKNIYAITKLFGESYLNNLDAVILRTNFYGIYPNCMQDTLLSWLNLELQKNNQIDGYDNVFFNPISINALCKNIETIIYNFIPGTYNIGSKDFISKYHFLQLIAEKMGYNSSLIKRTSISSSVLMRPTNMAMDVSKYENTYSLNLPKIINDIGNYKVLIYD